MTNPKTPAEMAEECQRLVRRVSDASYTQGIDERHDSPSRDQRNDDKVRALLAESRAAIDRLRAMAESAQQVVEPVGQPMPQKSPREPFLDQIDEARKSVAEWAEWMRDSTQVITPPLPIQLETRSAATKDQP